MTLQTGVFAIDGGPIYPGFHDPAVLWNGWNVPSFTKEVGLRIVEEYATAREEGTSSWELSYDAERDAFVAIDRDNPDFSDVADGIDTEAGRLYAIGNGWIWTDESEEVRKAVEWIARATDDELRSVCEDLGLKGARDLIAWQLRSAALSEAQTNASFAYGFVDIG